MDRCKKYRLCLVGLLVVVLVGGIIFYVKNFSESENAMEGTLVKNSGKEIGDEIEQWV